MGTADGTELINLAQASASNAAGGPENNTDNNTDTAVTIAYTPDMSLEKTASASAESGELITYELTYSNSGGAAARDVTIEEHASGGHRTTPRRWIWGTGRPPETVVQTPTGRPR
ncbi:MAG: hypothetical protein U5Q44_08725 [Dehalococcoidia bacterium]|nr:hypothetical protein [Dehalococcoidia bacterium]